MMELTDIAAQPVVFFGKVSDDTAYAMQQMLSRVPRSSEVYCIRREGMAGYSMYTGDEYSRQDMQDALEVRVMQQDVAVAFYRSARDGYIPVPEEEIASYPAGGETSEWVVVVSGIIIPRQRTQLMMDADLRWNYGTEIPRWVK